MQRTYVHLLLLVSKKVSSNSVPVMEPEATISNGSLNSPASSTVITSPHPLRYPSPSARLNDQVFESLKLEYQLMKVPFEQLKKSIRISHRLVEKEMNAVVSGVAEAVERDLSKEEAVEHLTNLVSRLQGLKRKVYKDIHFYLVFQRERDDDVDGGDVDVFFSLKTSNIIYEACPNKT